MRYIKSYPQPVDKYVDNLWTTILIMWIYELFFYKIEQTFDTFFNI